MLTVLRPGLERVQRQASGVGMLDRLSAGVEKLRTQAVKPLHGILLRVVEAKGHLQFAIPVGLVEARLQVQAGNVESWGNA